MQGTTSSSKDQCQVKSVIDSSNKLCFSSWFVTRYRFYTLSGYLEVCTKERWRIEVNNRLIKKTARVILSTWLWSGRFIALFQEAINRIRQTRPPNHAAKHLLICNPLYAWNTYLLAFWHIAAPQKLQHQLTNHHVLFPRKNNYLLM